MPVRRYHCRPDSVEAVQFEGDNVAEIAELLGWDGDENYDGNFETIYLNEGDDELEAGIGDWIVNGPEGVAILAPTEFADRYELDR